MSEGSCIGDVADVPGAVGMGSLGDWGVHTDWVLGADAAGGLVMYIWSLRLLDRFGACALSITLF